MDLYKLIVGGRSKFLDLYIKPANKRINRSKLQNKKIKIIQIFIWFSKICLHPWREPRSGQHKMRLDTVIIPF